MNNECELQEQESKERSKIISNGELKAKIKINFGKIIDIRERNKFDQGHIDQAISVPFDQFEEDLDKFDLKEQLNIIGDNERQTKKAGEILEEKGYKNYSLVLPGMDEW